jgi:AraC-like DNA-binding protein/streptogramin lyase
MWGGLASMEDGKVQLYDLKDGLGDLSVQSLLATPAGDVWIGTMKGLYRLSAEEKGIVPVPGIGDYPVTALCAAPDGSLLVGTMVEGLKAMTGSRWIDLFPEGDLADCHVRSILSPPDGQIWVGTEKSGLVRLKKRTVSSIGVAKGLPEGSVYPLLEDGPGSFWVGTESSGLCLLREGRVARVIGKEDGLAGKMVRVLSKDNAGRLWVGTMDGGISIIGGGSITNITSANGLPSDNVSEILFDDGGGMWIGTEKGLYRGRVERPEVLLPVTELEGQTIRALYRAGDGSIYAGTRGGLWKFSGESFARIGGASLEVEVLSIYIGADGTIWAGTNGQGLRSISEEKVRSFSARDGLPGNFIFSITRPGPSTVPDRDDGPLWISCEAGVFTIDADSLIAYSDGKTSILTPTLYDEAEGMPSSRCNGYCAPAFCVSDSGEIYYPTNGGLAVFGGEGAIGEAAATPKVVIEPLLVENARVVSGRNGEKGSSEEPLVFSGSVDRMEIRFTTIDWQAPEKCRFLYRLEGHDEGFTAVHPGQPRSAVYTDLPPGEYRFTVRAVGNTGLWSAEAATMAFTVKRPFYSTAWFILTVLAAAGLAAGVIVAVVRRRRIRLQGIKYSTSSITGERMDEAAEALRALMEEEKVFLDPDLTLKKLSQRLGIHYNHLSRIINEKHGESFNNFINRHRIEEAKRRLTDPAFDDKNILEIMLATGFYSKSTFNTAFRKFTGSSPSDFRKKNS